MSKNAFLALDVGNTNTTIGAFIDGKIVKEARLTTHIKATRDEWEIALRSLPLFDSVPKETFAAAAICSVCPTVDERLQQAVSSFLECDTLLLKPTGNLPFENAYNRPEDVGMDRLANSAAALQDFEPALIIIDFGTATTLDIVNQDRVYVGGVILPGIETTAEALYRRTSKLPQISISKPESAIGRNTIGAMQSGLYYGLVDAINGMIIRIEKELGVEATVVATGGLAPLITSEMHRVQRVFPHLTLRGIYSLWELQS